MAWSKCTSKCYKCKTKQCMLSKKHRGVCNCGKGDCYKMPLAVVT